MTRPGEAPRPWMTLAILAGWVAGTTALARSAALEWTAAGEAGAHAMELAIALTIVVVAESAGLFYLVGFIARSVTYLVRGPRRHQDGSGPTPPLAVLYLTAGDFDPVAVDSLLRLESEGPRLFLLHDDGADAGARARMASFIDAHPHRHAWEVRVLHRPQRTGGKAGAVNWVLERLETRWELILLCDSDSIALDASALVRAAREFTHPEIAVVQFRNAGYSEPEESDFHRRLTRAIDVYDAFATPQAAWGYLPFFGHNALIRTSELRRLGGLTPGFFSDDLDLSARLTLAGRRIVYRPDIAFAERHPADWLAFRKRARKWAFGCTQVVRARARAVLTARGLPLAHRVGLLEFMGFYPAQAVLVTGLAVAYGVLPWLSPARAATPGDVAAGAMVVLALVSPTLAWSVRHRRLREWPALAWTCALVYGGSILATVRGTIDGLSRRERPWVPTNLASRRPAVPAEAWGEAALGLVLFAVLSASGSAMLASPATYLFVAIFLFSPLTAAVYRESAPGGATVERRAGATRATAAAVLATVIAISAPHPVRAAAAPRVQARGERLFVDGHPFQVRGIDYSPWTPGTGPGGAFPYPGPAQVDRDLASIRSLGANTLCLEQAPGWVVQRAADDGLLSLYAFHIGWNDTSRAVFEAQAGAILAAVDSLRGQPGILAWILGNEVPPWVVSELGEHAVEGRLRWLATRVRAHDPGRLIGHANWPPTKQLDLSFMDLACFNLYPAWPYEVTVKGYGPYLREVLAPLARGRPLLITEFGINSLEAGETRQAQVLPDCWREIAAGPAVGGVVFEWCDEWWKNYDNPIPGRGYWERAYAPDDAARQDQDPEEYYGIVRADRSPKPAFAAVRAMWSPRHAARAWLPWALLGGLGLLTALLFGWSRRRRRAAVRTVSWAAFAALLVLGVPRPAAAALWTRADTLSGASPNDQMGWSLCGAGDLDGDGHGDAAVGLHFAAVGSLSAAGVVLVFRGGLPPSSPYSARLEGISANEHFGESLAGHGDVDGDGHPDLAVGAPLRTVGGLSAAGAVDVYRGGAALASGPWTTLAGEAANDWFGQSVAIGDVDGDGYADLIVGAPYNDRGGSAAGAVFIYRGGAVPPAAPWRVLVGEAANDQFGWSVAYAGDVDGDGYGDVVVGARLHGTGTLGAAGKVYLFRGGPAMDTVADRTWTGEAKDDWFGNAVAGPGDIDGGGRADVLVGAPYNDRGGSAAGAAYLFRGEDPPGSPPAVVYVGESADAHFGWSVAGAGDVDGNGRPDVVVGARMQASGTLSAAGRIYLFGGSPTLSTAPMATADGGAADDWFGNAVSDAIGYFDAGRGAALAGAPYQDATGLDAGRAYVLGMAPSLAVAVPGGHDPGFIAVPNPLVAESRIQWRGAGPGPDHFEIFDLTGRLLRSLAAGDGSDERTAVRWNGRDAAGRPVPPGIYLVRAHLGRSDSTPAPLRLVVVR